MLRSHHQRCWCHYWGEDPSICILKNKSSQRFYTGRMQKPSLFLAVPWSLPLGVQRNWSREGLKTCWSSHSFLRWNQDTDSGQLWSHSPQGRWQELWMKLQLMCSILLAHTAASGLESSCDVGILGKGMPLAVGSPKQVQLLGPVSKTREGLLPGGRSDRTQHSLLCAFLPINFYLN